MGLADIILFSVGLKIFIKEKPSEFFLFSFKSDRSGIFEKNQKHYTHYTYSSLQNIDYSRRKRKWLSESDMDAKLIR